MITVRDIMRVSEIHSDWVDCQLLNVSSRRRTGLPHPHGDQPLG
jgi:hypothetical protein